MQRMYVIEGLPGRFAELETWVESHPSLSILRCQDAREPRETQSAAHEAAVGNTPQPQAASSDNRPCVVGMYAWYVATSEFHARMENKSLVKSTWGVVKCDVCGMKTGLGVRLADKVTICVVCAGNLQGVFAAVLGENANPVPANVCHSTTTVGVG